MTTFLIVMFTLYGLKIFISLANIVTQQDYYKRVAHGMALIENTFFAVWAGVLLFGR